MKLGRITSLKNEAVRDIEVRITSKELFSDISDPPGVINASDVTGYEIAEDRAGLTCSFPDYSFRLFLRLRTGERTLFYAGATRFDLALLLDEFEAALPNVPRSQTKG
jgi:hypothetical protein